MNRFNTKNIQKTFGAAAGEYDQHAGLQQDVLAECVGLAKHNWQDHARILDLGTGTGALAQSGVNWYITGLDVSLAMCKTARTHGVTAVNANAEALPFADSAFDGVFSSLMLQWANDPLHVLKECFRVTKPGGRCVLSTFTHGTLEELRESFATLDSHQHINDFGPSNYVSALAVHAGFRLISSEENIITEYYPDVISFMRNLKSIGASTKEGKSRQGLMTPRQFKKLEQTYRKRYMHTDGLPASWHVMIMLLEKPQ